MKNYDLIQARNGTIPQFEGQDGQPKAVTGDHGPYYQLVDVNGNPLFSENNPAHVQLTGRNVEEIYLYDALAITDTSVYRVTGIDTSKYKKITILAESTLDQNVELLFYAGFDNIQSRFYDKETDSWVITYDNSITLTTDNTYRYILNTKWDFLNEVNFKTISMRARCGTAPTSGSLTVKLIGVLN